MTDKKKQPKKTATAAPPGTETGNLPPLDFSGKNEENTGNEPWQEWKVKPELKPMPSSPHESGIGKRIAYCRGQLDNLSVEALARYTKKFDQVGVSKASLVRYEGGDSVPGARELRILCDALWVPPNWLLLGSIDVAQQEERYEHLDKWFMLTLKGMGLADSSQLEFLEGITERTKKAEIERRKRWIDEARKPPIKM